MYIQYLHSVYHIYVGRFDRRNFEIFIAAPHFHLKQNFIGWPPTDFDIWNDIVTLPKRYDRLVFGEWKVLPQREKRWARVRCPSILLIGLINEMRIFHSSKVLKNENYFQKNCSQCDSDYTLHADFIVLLVYDSITSRTIPLLSIIK